jgi:two-component system KDP operon response regulator KdpE
MNHKPVILIIDDEIQIQRLLQMTLDGEGYATRAARTGADGVRLAASERPDLIVLDLGLPDLDGKSVLKRIREWSAVPILILSVRNAESEIVGCLDAGANDYLVKPFRTGELVARVRNALRHRGSPDQDAPSSFGNVVVDLKARVVKKKGEALKLTSTEYSLLALLVQNAGKVMTHRFILEQVWGPSHSEETQYTRVYIGQLRKKIEDDHANPKLIVTESGIGYRLVTDEG